MHKDKRAQKIKSTGGSGKEAVLGIVERSTEDSASRIKTMHVPNVRKKTLAPEVRAAVQPGATIYTDALKSYLGLSAIIYLSTHCVPRHSAPRQVGALDRTRRMDRRSSPLDKSYRYLSAVCPWIFGEPTSRLEDTPSGSMMCGYQVG